ncbi:MAG: PHP domain-containing protein [Candidatus Woesearchaeota archaeon]
MHTDKVRFEKPDITTLRKTHTVVDLHFHSKHSDGINTITSIAERARKLGIGIAITDHNAIKGALEIDRFKSILSIPGIEVTSREGTHVLIYFYDTQSLKLFYMTYIVPNLGNDVMSSTKLPLEDVIRYARKFKTVIIFPHPYAAGYTGICNSPIPEEAREQLFSKVHGTEALNAENLHRWNLRSTILGFNLGKSMIGGSDGHTLYHMGKVVTCFSCKPNRKAILDAIVKNKTVIIGKEIDMLRKATSNSFKMRMNIKNYPELIEKNIKYSYTILNNRTRNLRRKVGTRLQSFRTRKKLSTNK